MASLAVTDFFVGGKLEFRCEHLLSVDVDSDDTLAERALGAGVTDRHTVPQAVVDGVVVARGNAAVLLLDDGRDDEDTGSCEEGLEPFAGLGGHAEERTNDRSSLLLEKN